MLMRLAHTCPGASGGTLETWGRSRRAAASPQASAASAAAVKAAVGPVQMLGTLGGLRMRRAGGKLDEAAAAAVWVATGWSPC